MQNMKEIAVISGKGGTGKTSIVASFAALASSIDSRQTRNAVLADCDVDAADLHLLLAPTVLQREEFRCGHEAVILQENCIGCGACLARCRFGAVKRVEAAETSGYVGDAGKACRQCDDGCSRACPSQFAEMIRAMRETCLTANREHFLIDLTACGGCGVCVTQCPVKAIDFPERVSGEWFISETRFGPMVHAKLKPGGENSGKLVSHVRETARRIATERSADFVLVDGPPGVGCAVIASISGASKVLVVTEPTLSGAHDMARVLELTRHFGIPTAVCVNKWDLNAEMTERIEAEARRLGAEVAGRVRYDRAVTAAQMHARTVIETDTGPLSDDIRTVWESIRS